MAKDIGAGVKDITDSIRSDKASLIAAEEAESSNRAKSQLLENKSHEIRTYMTRIISMTDLTLMTELTEEQQDYLTIVKSSTSLLLKVLNDIMDYSKILDGKVDLVQVPFDLRESIHEVVDMFQVASKQKNISLRHKSLDKITLNKLIGDPLRLKQVLSNLIANSVRFTNRGEVTLNIDLEELNESRVKLKFHVSDTGIGIPEDKLLNLIGLLNQVDDSNLKKLGGTGLTIAKKLVELMDGDIGIESKEGIGSNVSFSAVFDVQGQGGGHH